MPRFNVPSGNVNGYIVPIIQNKNYATAIVTNRTVGDPASGCRKNFNATYKCGSGPIKISEVLNETGKPAIFDCSQEDEKCSNYKLTVQDDGNLVITNGVNTIWQSNTAGKVGLPDPKKRAINGKYGRDYLKPGEYLEDGEFIGSKSGTCFLEMLKGTGLQLKYNESNCSKIGANTYSIYDSAPLTSFATYTIPLAPGKEVLGKAGYITEDGKLKTYPSKLLSPADDYIEIGRYGNIGADLKTISGKSASDCMTGCNESEGCDGFEFQLNNGKCYLKTAAMFPFSARKKDKNSVLYRRNVSVHNDSSCGKSVKPVDADFWQSMPQDGEMTEDLKCNLRAYTSQRQNDVDVAGANLKEIGDRITSKMKNLTVEEKQLLEQYGISENKVKTSLKDYELVKQQYEDSRKNMDQYRGMDSNAHSFMTSSNYYLILSSILAILLVIGGIKLSK